MTSTFHLTAADITPPLTDARAREIAASFDLRRLPALAAGLGLAVRVARVDWGQGVDDLRRAERVIGEVR